MDDILETVHHFQAIDYVIDIAEKELTEDIIKHLHYILKHETKDSTLEWFAVGDYKKRANVVGGRETSKPSEVHKHMEALLAEYNAKENASVEDIIAFHAEFEYIHPFQDDGVIIRTSQLRQAKSRLALICPDFLSQMGHEVGRRRKISYLQTEVGWEYAAA